MGNRLGRNKKRKLLNRIAEGLGEWSPLQLRSEPTETGMYLVATLPYTERTSFDRLGWDWRKMSHIRLAHYNIGLGWKAEMMDINGQSLPVYPNDIVSFIKLPELPLQIRRKN